MRTSLLTALFLTVSSASAQDLLPAYVTDTFGDTIWFCDDLDDDGTYNGAGEVTAFYDDSVGPFALTNNAGLIRDEFGAIYVSDTSQDSIFRFIDLDGDGNAHGVGEAAVWFDGTSGNPSGVELTSGRGLWRDADGVLWVATANSGGGGNDAIVRLEDVNGDGDANDAGESLEYFVAAPGGATGDSIPTAVTRGPDGAIYYVETGSTSLLAKGVYRLEDLDGSGSIDSSSEVTAFFLPPDLGGSPFHWDIGQDALGNFYLNDTGNDVIWRFADADGDGTVDASEATVVYTATGSSLIWEITPAPDGSLYVAEDQNPDRLLRLVDGDGDGVFDAAAEVQTIYDETVAAINFGSPKGVVIVTGELPIGSSQCGPAVANSTGAAAEIAAFGSTSVTTNEVLVRASRMPASTFGIFAVSQGLSQTSFTPPGSDGRLCLNGAIGRYNTVLNSGAAGEFELAIDLDSIPQGGALAAVVAGETWHFQGWFRDANPTATSNFTDAVSITFVQ